LHQGKVVLIKKILGSPLSQPGLSLDLLLRKVVVVPVIIRVRVGEVPPLGLTEILVLIDYEAILSFVKVTG